MVALPGQSVRVWKPTRMILPLHFPTTTISPRNDGAPNEVTGGFQGQATAEPRQLGCGDTTVTDRTSHPSPPNITLA